MSFLATLYFCPASSSSLFQLNICLLIAYAIKWLDWLKQNAPRFHSTSNTTNTIPVW